MNVRRDLYLVTVSILLGVSIFKVPGMIEVAQEMDKIFANITGQDLTAATVGVILFGMGYTVFFIAATSTSVAIVYGAGINESSAEYEKRLNTLVLICFTSLIGSYFVALITILKSVTAS